MRAWKALWFVLVILFVRELIGEVCLLVLGDQQIVATFIMDAVSIGVGFWACRRFFAFSESPTEVLPVTDNRHVLAFLLVVGGACWLMAQIMASGIYYLTQDSNFDVYSSTMDSVPIGTLLLLTCVVAPVAEEIVFRGCIFGALRQGMSVILAAIISSIIFVVVHGTLTHVPVTTTVGMVSCALYALTGKLRWSIGFHALSNAASYAIGFVSLPVEVIVSPVWVLLWALLFSFVGTVLVGESRSDRVIDE